MSTTTSTCPNYILAAKNRFGADYLVWGSPDHSWACVSFVDTVTLFPTSYAAHRLDIDWWKIVNLAE